MATKPKRACKVDLNQKEIVDGLRAISGVTVEVLSGVGSGVPDIMVGKGGYNYFMEIKGDKGKLTPDQIKWHSEWAGQVAIVRSVDDALGVLSRRV